MAGLKARNTEALEELLRRHGSEIKAVAFLIVRSEGDADEVVSDTMLTAWRKIGQLRDARTLRPWLLQIASRLALRRRRRFAPQLVNLEAARDVAGQATDPISRPTGPPCFPSPARCHGPMSTKHSGNGARRLTT